MLLEPKAQNSAQTIPKVIKAMFLRKLISVRLRLRFEVALARSGANPARLLPPSVEWSPCNATAHSVFTPRSTIKHFGDMMGTRGQTSSGLNRVGWRTGRETTCSDSKKLDVGNDGQPLGTPLL
jgi:hypothetical protein